MKQSSAAELSTALSREFDISEDLARTDVANFITELRERQVLELEPAVSN